MTLPLSENQVRCLRLRGQRILPRVPGTGACARVVREVCGLQAQDRAAAALGVRARSVGLAANDVERALVGERSVVRTWVMRGTLHLLAADELGWLLALLGPVFVAAGRRRREELGLDDDTYARGLRALREALAARGPLTRPEIVALLGASGVALVGQAAPHLLGRAALEGVICFGPDRGREPTYVLLADWLGPLAALPEDEAMDRLVRRYLAAYAPAGPADFAAWSGLPQGRIKAAWQRLTRECLEVAVGGRQAWILTEHAPWLDEAPPAGPAVALLPAYDTYLLGYRNRDLIIAAEHARRVHPGGGVLRPTVLVDGRVAGTWSARPSGRRHLEVQVSPFEPPDPAVGAGIEAEAADVGRFRGLEARLSLPAPG